VATALVEVLLYGEEIERRDVNPWLDLARAQLRSAGQELRRLAAEEPAVEQRIDERLRLIADKLDDVVAHRLTMGRDSWDKLFGLVGEAVKESARLKADFVDPLPLSAEAKAGVEDTIRRSARELADLDRRAEQMASDGRLGEVQDAASRIGRSLLTVSYYSVGEPSPSFSTELREIGRELHLLETERVYMDGGRSARSIVGRVGDLTKRLQDLVAARPP
jgi:hypothetical protein